jgi:hypothetical protein
LREPTCIEKYVSWSQNHSLLPLIVFKTGAHSGAGEATIPLSVRAAVNNGLFSSQKPDASFNCRTGNCTYASEYSSVAYCSACLDATHQLNFTQYSQYDEVINRTFPYTNVSLSVDRGRNLVLSHGGPSMSLGYVNLNSYAGSNADIAMIRWNGVNAVPGNTETIRGYRCSLYPCIKTFRANVSTGKLKEEVVNESTDVFSWTGSVGSTADLNCLDNPDQRRTLTQLGYKLNDTMRWLPYNVSMINGTTQNPVYQQSPNFNPCKTAPANQYNDLCNGGNMTTKAIEVVPARCIYAMGMITVSSLNMNLFYQMFTGIIRGSWGYGHAGYDGAEALTALFNAGSGNGTRRLGWRSEEHDQYTDDLHATSWPARLQRARGRKNVRLHQLHPDPVGVVVLRRGGGVPALDLLCVDGRAFPHQPIATEETVDKRGRGASGP